ncbi:GNAT family N-acetyltransferase [Arenimonas alkanexedens]
MALPFPDRPGAGTVTPAWLAERGFLLRPARDADLPRLRDIYADTRADEMARVPWPGLVKRSFLEQQFALQHQHYLVHYAAADFLVIEHERVLQGRYYLLREGDADLIVDISLMADWRGRGIGSALIEHSQRDAAARGRGMTLHVVRDNLGARRLYQRLGFALAGDDDGGTHRRMDWPAPSLS